MTAPAQAPVVTPGPTPQQASPVATGDTGGVGSSQSSVSPAPILSVAQTGSNTPAPTAETAPQSLALRAWNVVLDGASALRDAITRTFIFTWIWNCLTSPFCSATPAERLAAYVTEISRDGPTNADILLAFNGLLAAPNAAGFTMADAAVATQLRAGYNALPQDVKTALNDQLRATAQAAADTAATAAAGGTATIGTIATTGTLVTVADTTNLRDAAVATQLRAAVTTMRQGLPSVALGDMETRLTAATTNLARVGILQEMIAIREHPLDPDTNVAVISARVAAAFTGLNETLRQALQEAIWSSVEQNHEATDLQMTDGTTLSTGHPDFGGAILRRYLHLPEAAVAVAVAAGLDRWVANNQAPATTF